MLTSIAIRLVMKFGRKILPNNYSPIRFSTKKKLHEDEINFELLRSYRLERVKKELEKRDIGACILFDPVNVRYALDSTNMSVYNMHSLNRYCFIPVNGSVILFEFFNCEQFSKHLKLIDEVRVGTTWDYFVHGDQADKQLKKWVEEVTHLMDLHCGKNKRIAIDVSNAPAILALAKTDLKILEGKEILEQARVIKSKEEIQCMKASIEVAELGVVLMRDKLQAGMTEEELWALLHKTNIEYGGEWIECRLLASGQRTNPWMQECSNKIIQKGEIVSFDTDMVGPYGYCADISRTFVEGHKFSSAQKKLYQMAREQIEYNANLIKAGVSFREFSEKSWNLPDAYYPNRYSCMVHGIGLCDEWPFIKYPTDGGQRRGFFEKNMTVSIESYIGEVGGKEGVKLEQQYLVTDKGLELLSHHLLEEM